MDLQTIYKDLKNTIDEIDEKLDSLEDPTTSGKRKVVNEAVTETEEVWKSIVENLSGQLGNAEVPDRTKVGVYFGIVRGLNKAYDEFAKGVVDKIVAEQPKQEALITPEEATALSKVRPELYQKIKAVVELATQFGDSDGMEMPRRRTGSKGPRGKRKASYITWSIDGTEVSLAVGTLKPVVEMYPQYEKVSELTKALKDANVDLSDPGKEGNVLSFQLPDGRTLTGDYSPPENPEEDTSEDTDSDEDDSEEETE